MIQNNSDIQKIILFRNELTLFREHISKLIKSIRALQNITYETIENETGLSRSTLHRIENNTGDYKLENAFYVILAISSHLNSDNNMISAYLIAQFIKNYPFTEKELLLKMLS